MSDYVSSTIATGGAGYNFEHKVGAQYLISLLNGTSPLGISGIVKEVGFQQKDAGYLLDDIVVITDDNGVQKRCAIQVRLNTTFTKLDESFRKLLENCWKMFIGKSKNNFDAKRDILAIIVSNYPQKVHNYLIPVLDYAKKSSDQNDFLDKLEHTGNSNHMMKYYNMFRNLLNEFSKESLSDKKIWEFFRVFKIISLDFTSDNSLAQNSCLQQCLNILGSKKQSDADSLFSKLIVLTSQYSQDGRIIDRNSLYRDLKDYEINVPINFANDYEILRKYTEHRLNGIHDIIGDVNNNISLPRTELINDLENKLSKTDVLLLSGNSLVGKSTAMKLLVEKLKNLNTAFVFSTQQMDELDFDVFLQGLKIKNNFIEILSVMQHTPYIFIDGLDRLVYNDKTKKIVCDLLTKINSYIRDDVRDQDAPKCCKIIATCRKFDVNDILNILNKYDFKVENFEIPVLTTEDFNSVKNKINEISYLSSIKNLSELLLYPGYLDMFSRRINIRYRSLPKTITESWCFDTFWKQYILVSIDGVTGGRGRDRAFIMKHVAMRILDNSPLLNDANMDNAALDGLLSEEIIKESRSRLIFSHDIFEDYALAMLIDENQNDLENFFLVNKYSRKLLRSFTLFISKILDVDEDSDHWYEIFKILVASKISPIWQHECLSSLVNSNNLDNNLILLKNHILKDKGNLLYELIKTLQAQSDRSKIEYLNKIVELLSHEDKVYLETPPLDKCESLIQFTIDEITKIDNKCLLELFKLIRSCITRIGRTIKIRVSDLSIKLYEDIFINEYYDIFKLNFDDKRSFEKLLIDTIIWTVDVNKKPVVEFIEKYSIDTIKKSESVTSKSKITVISTRILTKSKITQRNHRFDDIIIQNYGWIPLCQFVPKMALNLIKSIFCYKPNPEESYYETISTFGIHDFHVFSIPTHLKGPFFGFLSLNEETGLELIHNIINHATEIWKLNESKRIPVPQIVNLTEKPIEVYGDGRVYCWSEYMGNNPVITSALMALEKWMENKINAGTSPKSITEKVMSGTISVAVIGVCLSILLKYINKSHDAILPILENPIFWDMDTKRFTNIIQEIPLLEMHSKMYANNTSDQNACKIILSRAKEEHRRVPLTTFVPHILFSGNQEIRNAMIEKLELFPTKVPHYYKDEVNDKSKMKIKKEQCEIWAKFAKIKNYSRKVVGDKLEIECDPNMIYTNEQQLQNINIKKIEDWITFYQWSKEFIDGSKVLDKPMIKSTIEYIDKFDHELLKINSILTEKTLRESITNFIGGLIIHNWDTVIELNQEKRCLKHFDDILRLNYHDESEVQVFPHGIDRAVAKTLPTLFVISKDHSKYSRFCKKRKYQKNIIKYASLNNNEVVKFLFIALKKLWNNDDKLIFKCIEQTRNSCELKDPHNKPYLNERKLITIMYVFDNLPEIENLDSIDRTKNIFSNLLEFTIKSYQDGQMKDGYNTWKTDGFEWNHNFFVVLSQFILKFEPHKSSLLKQIDNNWKETPVLMEEFIRYLLYVGTDPKFKDVFIELWTYYTNIILDSLKDNNFDYKFNDEINNIKSLLIFSDPLKIISLGENTTPLLSEIIPCIEKWCDMFDNDIECLENLMSMLNTIGFNLMVNFGIKWLDRFINNIKKDLFIEKQLPEKLARLLWRTLDNYESDIQQNLHTYDQLIKITDFLVSTNDRLAPKIKDKLQKIHENEKIR